LKNKALKSFRDFGKNLSLQPHTLSDIKARLKNSAQLGDRRNASASE
jgi:hypothetical protein